MIVTILVERLAHNNRINLTALRAELQRSAEDAERSAEAIW